MVTGGTWPGLGMCCSDKSDNDNQTFSDDDEPLPGHVPVTLVQQLPDPPPHLVQAPAPGPEQQLNSVTCISQSEGRQEKSLTNQRTHLQPC